MPEVLEKKIEENTVFVLVNFSWLARLFCTQLNRRPFASGR